MTNSEGAECSVPERDFARSCSSACDLARALRWNCPLFCITASKLINLASYS